MRNSSVRNLRFYFDSVRYFSLVVRQVRQCLMCVHVFVRGGLESVRRGWPALLDAAVRQRAWVHVAPNGAAEQDGGDGTGLQDRLVGRRRGGAERGARGGRAPPVGHPRRRGRSRLRTGSPGGSPPGRDHGPELHCTCHRIHRVFSRIR